MQTEGYRLEAMNMDPGMQVKACLTALSTSATGCDTLGHTIFGTFPGVVRPGMMVSPWAKESDTQNLLEKQLNAQVFWFLITIDAPT